MIITRLIGGLGNQMFQYAAGLSLAEANRTVLKLDVSWYKVDPAYEAHNRYALSCFNVTEQFATDEEIDRVRGVTHTRAERWTFALARMVRLHQYAKRSKSPSNWHRPQTFKFYPEFLQQPDSTYIDGMFQSDKFFAAVAPMVRQHFSQRYPSRPEIDALAQRIRKGPSIAVHFRRGDYASKPAFAAEMGTIDIAYYDKAIRMIAERVPNATCYVFSDDIESVAKEFVPPIPHHFIREVHHWESFEKIRLMALCEHAIIANSTFSWWGAWLGTNPDRIVVAPDPWFKGGDKDGSNMAPDSWIRLKR